MEYDELTQAVIDGDAPRAEMLTRQAIEQGMNAEAVLAYGLIQAMSIVGERFGTGEIYVPEMLIAARAMKKCLLILKPILAQGSHEPAGTVVIGTVKGDIHDVGKNIVSIMLEGAGFEVHDLGVDVTPEAFVRAVEDERPDIVGLSALLTTTMLVMRDVIAALATAGVRDKVKVLVGGAPVTDEFATEIGADAYAPDAAAASVTAKSLIASAVSVGEGDE
jgi:5-methyltetrahydrofolate--homocysteine methyltransferase